MFKSIAFVSCLVISCISFKSSASETYKPLAQVANFPLKAGHYNVRHGKVLCRLYAENGLHLSTLQGVYSDHNGVQSVAVYTFTRVIEKTNSIECE